MSCVKTNSNPLSLIHTKTNASDSPKTVFWFATVHGIETCSVLTWSLAHSGVFSWAVLSVFFSEATRLELKNITTPCLGKNTFNVLLDERRS